jgi:predicted PurR-regulated permease PerM
MKPFRAELYPSIFLVLLTFIAIVVLWSIMDMVLLGASLAIVLMPLHHRLSGRLRPVIASLVITAGVAAIVLGTAALTLQLLTTNASVLTTIFSAIGTWLNTTTTNPTAYGVPIAKSTLSGMLNIGDSLFVNYENTLLDYLPLILFKIFVFFFSLGIFLATGDQIKSRIMASLPRPIHSYITKMSDVTVETLYVVYVVQIAIAVLTFFISLPVFYLLGYGNIIFYSFLAAFCELIPVLGSSVAFLLVGAYALSIGDTKGVFILFILGYLIVACLPEITIRPVLVGRRVKVNPVIMFIGIIGGILTMGLAGFVLGPLIVVLLITSYRMYVRDQKEPGSVPTA